MKRTRTTRSVEFMFERREFLVVPERRAQTLTWCEECGMRTQFVTAEEAAHAAGASVRAVFRRIDAAEIHFVETCGGSVLVCLESLR